MRKPLVLIDAASTLSLAGCGSSSLNPEHSPTASGQSPAVQPVTIMLPATTCTCKGAVELAAGPDALWVADGVFRINTASYKVSPGLDTTHGDDVGYISVGADSVWGSDYGNGAVRRYDINTGKLVASVPLDTAEGIAVTPDAIWVASHHGGTLVRIDPTTNKIVATVALTAAGPAGPQGVAAGLGSIWVGVPNQNAVFRVNPATNAIMAKITSTSGMDPCGDLSVGTSSVWLSECLDSTHVIRIDPAANAVVAKYDTGGKVASVAATGDSVWFVTGGDPDAAPQPRFLEELAKDGPTTIPAGLMRRITTRPRLAGSAARGSADIRLSS